MKIKELNGIYFYIGRTAKENWLLLDNSKKINQAYIWFHLNSFASPYVIMYATLDELDKLHDYIDISNNKITVDEFLQYGAQLCKEYSKYKSYNNLKIMYTPINKLTKTNNIGEVDVKGKTKLITL